MERPHYDNRDRYGGGNPGQQRGRQPQPYNRQPRDDRSRSRGPPPPRHSRPVSRRREHDVDYEVQTNYFKITPLDPSQQGGSCYEYRATIYAARLLKRGPDGQLLSEPQVVVKTRKNDNDEPVPVEVSMEKGATQKTENIMLALHKSLLNQDPPQHIATDGGATLFASDRLFDGSKPGKPPATSASRDPMEEEVEPETSLSFKVCIKKDDCREDDDFADLVPNVYFIVTLTEVGALHFSASNGSLWPVRDDQVQKFSQFVNIVTKTSMLMRGYRSYGKSTTYYPPEERQGALQGGPRVHQRGEAPLVGLNQSARACVGIVSQDMYVARNTAMSWFRLSSYTNGGKIPILKTRDADNAGKPTIAGVRIPSLHEPVPEDLRGEIQTRLEAVMFHVTFTSTPTDEAKQLCRKKWEGKRTEEEIDEIVRTTLGTRDIVKPYLWMRQSGSLDRPLIVWSADDADATFQYGDENVTVCSYMKRRHGIILQYPKMPIILTRYGYYPIEWMFQAFGIRKGADSDSHKEQILNYHDNNAGEMKIPAIQRVADDFSTTEVEQHFGFGISREPVKQKAKLLAEPRLEFGDEPVDVRNGSWNLVRSGRAISFQTPADIMSYCVVDFTTSSTFNGQQLITNVLDRSTRHGLKNVQYQNEYSTVTSAVTFNAGLVRGGNVVQKVYDSIQNSVTAAKEFFLHDNTGFFYHRRTFFKTLLAHPEGKMTECLVYQVDPTGGDKTLAFIYPQEVLYATHTVQYKGDVHEARMYVVVQDRSGRCYSVDPFDFRWNAVISSVGNVDERKFDWEARLASGPQWERVSFQAYEWKLASNQAIIVNEDAVASCLECHGSWQIECPSIVFAILPDTDKELYNLVKLVTNFYLGIQSQCLVQKTYERQRNQDQYCSNIALKLNTKLSNSMNKAQAWQIGDYRKSRGMPWVSDDTLIVGIALSRGSGRDSKTVVAATASLVDGSGCMKNCFALRIQSSPDIVQSGVMQCIMKALSTQFWKHSAKFPREVLVFRDGCSEGSFPSLVDTEISGIRKALADVWKEMHIGTNLLSVFEPPKLTYVVCVNQHNVQVVPVKGSVKQHSNVPSNVPSGTCVDEIIMPFSEMSVDDFLLTAQGGLKGTSKPVFYRPLVNENPSLNRDVLESVVYGLSFYYGTATKAPRRLSVVQYSKRLAEQFLAYLPYIDGRIGGLEGLPILMNGPAEDEVFRSDQENEDNDALRSELLPGFAPGHCENRLWHPPMRPHLAS